MVDTLNCSSVTSLWQVDAGNLVSVNVSHWFRHVLLMFSLTNHVAGHSVYPRYVNKIINVYSFVYELFDLLTLNVIKGT